MKVTKVQVQPAKITAEIELTEEETQRILQPSQQALTRLITPPTEDATIVEGEYSAEDAKADLTIDQAKFDENDQPRSGWPN